MFVFGQGIYGGTVYGGQAGVPSVAFGEISTSGYAATIAFDPVLNDVHFSSLKIVKGDAAIEQKVRQRLKFWLGEWFLDQRLGVPYRSFLGMKNPSIPAIQGIISQAILSVKQITTIQSMSVDWDRPNRSANLNFVGVMSDGRTITAKDEPLIVQ